MGKRVYGLVLASLLLIAGTLGLSGCDDPPTKPGAVVQPLHATGQTNTQPPIIIDATLRPGTSSGGQQPIEGAYTATPVGGTSFSGSIVGTVAGTFDNNGNGGTFTGTVRANLPGCTASRPYQGPLTRTTLAWVGQPPTETCGGSSPLTFDVTLGVTVESSDPPSPSVVVAPTSAAVTSGQQTGTAQVTANTSWTAASNQSWLTIVNGASGGSGTTTLTYAVQANAVAARSGTITIAHGSTTARLTVNQAVPVTPDPTLAIVALAPNPASLSASAQTGTATVTASNVMSWTSSSDASWLTIPNGGSGGSGSSTLTYSAQVNAGSASRQGTITISAAGATSATLTVTQQGTTPTPTLAMGALAPNPASLTASAQTGTATVTASNVTSWTSSSDAAWLTIPSGGSGGSGSSTLTYSAQANAGTASRQGTITISAAGATSATLTVTQQGTTPTPAVAIVALAPNPASLTASAQTGTATVTASNVTSWTSSSDAAWLTLTGGASGGAGSSTLTYSAAANAGSASRQGTITISATGATPATLIVTQAGAASLTIAPPAASITASAQSGSATVTAINVGAWTAAASSTGSWLSITSGASGGNGTTTLNYSAQANSGALRTATITVSAGGVPSSISTVTQGAGGPSTISWRYNVRVHGTVVGFPAAGGGPISVPVPANTLATIDLSFNSATPNDCPTPPGGRYLIGMGSGISNTASITFLGYRYVAIGGIEVGDVGPCSNGLSSGLRLFVVDGSSTQIDPGGTLLLSSAQPNGALFMAGPNAPSPGVLPTVLPSNPFSTGGSVFASPTISLIVESVQISTVIPEPEPVTDLLLGIGVVGMVVTRRLARSQKVRR